jgi:hypothetical protein
VHRGGKNACSILFEKPERKKSPVRPRRRWEDDVKVYRRKILVKA